jgi:hypothetical protein
MTRRDGNQIHYRIADDAMLALCRAVCRRMAKTMDKGRPLRHQLLKLIPSLKKRAA